jgi:zinc protease
MRSVHRIFVSLIALAAITAALPRYAFAVENAPAQPAGGVRSYQLDNGMKVLVLENHRAPVVVSQVWYKVGGSYEHDGITGISHVIEHMMFKGTPKYPAGKFSEIIAANGGKENAFTSMDYTAFFQRIASDRLELCLQLESDRMRNLLLSADEFKKEIEVIKEERRMRTDDSPTALTYERFNAIAYNNSPYRHPIIGWMEDLDTMTVDDVRDWYRTWYAPNNATLVVVGDVNADDVLKLATTYFGPLKPSVIPKLKPRREIEQHGVQRVQVRVPAKVPYLIMGYKAPELSNAQNSDEAYALEVLSGLLDGGSSSRLTRDLVRGKQIATSVSASYDLYAMHDSVFTLMAVPAGNTGVEELEAALKQELRDIQQNPPAAEELERVKAQVVASNVYEQDSSFYLGMQLGILETTGLGWQRKDEYVDRVNAVTAKQVQQVAQRYFSDDRLTVAVLDPLPLDSTTEHTATAESGHAH